MTLRDIIQMVLFFALLTGLAPLVGNYIYLVLAGKNHAEKAVPGFAERLVSQITGTRAYEEMDWKSYASGVLWFNLAGLIFLFAIQLLQSHLPLNPNHLADVSWHSALNTSVSFITNTNWQGYAGETTLSYFVQMTGLTVQNFVSAGTGIAVLMAVVRGITGRDTDKIGNFWADLVRSVFYVLLPISVVLAVVLAGQGVIQNFSANETVQTLEHGSQVIPMGPVASQIAIKQAGTNGGGFFNSNSSHPFENPTPFSNFLEMLFILLIPAALTITYGRMLGSVRHGWLLFSVMMILLITGLLIALYGEYSGNPLYGNMHLMEGKETRFGVANSVLWAVSTTAASNGSVNSMHESLSPLAGMVAMLNIMLGEVVFGGVGAGLYGMIVFIIMTVFIAGLMVGRTPEYAGKKIEAFEVQMAMVAILAPAAVILAFSALAAVDSAGLSGLNNGGPHGLSEILYAYSSAAGNNGSAFAGLKANTPYYDLTLAAGMLIGRFGVIIPALAIAGSLARKKYTPPSTGTFNTDNWLFIILLIAVILIVGALTFFPALSLGPVLEHLLLQAGITF